MDRWCTFPIILLGFASCRHDDVSGSVSEVTVRPGDNITLFCDCEKSTGAYIVWYRNCSHENQPTLVLQFGKRSHSSNIGYSIRPLPRFEFLFNESSKSYDLLITSITDSDEGLYYCGTEQIKVEDDKYISSKKIYSYGNATTRIIVSQDKEDHLDRISCSPSSVPAVSWMLMVFTPALTILSSFLFFILFYHFCQKKEEEVEVLQKRSNSREQPRQRQNVCLTGVVYCVKAGQTRS